MDKLSRSRTITRLVRYKKPLPTPGLLYCTAKIERVEGGDRKIFIRATLEDGNGTVYTIGEGLFVKLAVKL